MPTVRTAVILSGIDTERAGPPTAVPQTTSTRTLTGVGDRQVTIKDGKHAHSTEQRG
jgi:hypothetical protein